MKLIFILFLFVRIFCCRYINDVLRRKFEKTSTYVEVFISSVSKTEYGLRAVKSIPAGTMLGFYEGTVMPKSAVSHSNEYAMDIIPANLVIDASDFLCGYGRYMNCATLPQLQNVSFEKVDSKRPHKRIIMVTTVPVAEGSELFVQYGVEYWHEKKLHLPAHASCSRKFCNKMIKMWKKNTLAIKKHNDFVTPLRAQELKEMFDNESDDEEDDGDDPDYVDE